MQCFKIGGNYYTSANAQTVSAQMAKSVDFNLADSSKFWPDPLDSEQFF